MAEQVNGFGQPGHAEKVIHHGKALREDAHALAGELRGAVDDIQSKLDIAGRMERNPYQTLAIAAGIGYVLGGGLLTPFTGRALRWGFRLVLLPVLRNELMSLTQAATGSLMNADQ